MCELVGPVLNSESGTGESGVVAICCDAATALVDEEFEVEKRALAFWETAEDVGPAALVLVAVRKLDVGVDERN